MCQNMNMSEQPSEPRSRYDELTPDQQELVDELRDTLLHQGMSPGFIKDAVDMHIFTYRLIDEFTTLKQKDPGLYAKIARLVESNYHAEVIKPIDEFQLKEDPTHEPQLALMDISEPSPLAMMILAKTDRAKKMADQLCTWLADKPKAKVVRELLMEHHEL